MLKLTNTPKITYTPKLTHTSKSQNPQYSYLHTHTHTYTVNPMINCTQNPKEIDADMSAESAESAKHIMFDTVCALSLK